MTSISVELWFQRRLPPYVCKFLEMCLMIMAAQPSGHYALPGGKSMDRSNNGDIEGIKS